MTIVSDKPPVNKQKLVFKGNNTNNYTKVSHKEIILKFLMKKPYYSLVNLKKALPNYIG